MSDQKNALKVEERGNPVPQPQRPTTFVEFAITSQGLDPEFVDRVRKSGADIQSLDNLVRFARQRWPDQYPKDWRRNTSNMRFGREAMGSLWGQYLKAREQ